MLNSKWNALTGSKASKRILNLKRKAVGMGKTSKRNEMLLASGNSKLFQIAISQMKSYEWIISKMVINHIVESKFDFSEQEASNCKNFYTW